MNTKTERADILLDAIGFIGEDIIAESSGVSNVLPIPSKLRLNLIIMRRLLAAAICVILLSAITPISMYLYEQVLSANPAGTVAPETTETTEDSTEPPEIPVGASIDSLPSEGDSTVRDLFHEEYVILNGGELKTYDIAISDRGSTLIRGFCPALFRDRETDESALYFDIRNIRGEIVGHQIRRGEGILLIDSSAPARLFVFNIFISDGENRILRAEYDFYGIVDGEILCDTAKGGAMDISLTDTSDGEVKSFFEGMYYALGNPSDYDMYLNSYLEYTKFRHPIDLKENIPGERYWSLDYIKELFAYRFDTEKG